jgi:peptidoglycan/xylan/chitin deacetylase (PgdA/CDA1 family)
MMSAVKTMIAAAVPLRAIAARCAPILTYHACFDQPPAEIPDFDNIIPESLYEQISHLKKAIRLVPIDELACCKSFKGLGAVTFDDGYKSVIKNALPVFQALDVPFTVFVNTFAFRERRFWRHKVMYLINSGLGRECEEFFRSDRRVPGKSFYAALKDPQNNSKEVEEEIDCFLEYKGLRPDIPQYFLSAEDFVAHPLIWYGNHTHNHYVLASLSPGEQRHEIETTRDLLAGIPGIQLSGCVALPFGQADQSNSDTLVAVRESGYRILALNRGGVNVSPNPAQQGVVMLERFSVTASPITWNILRECANTRKAELGARRF